MPIKPADVPDAVAINALTESQSVRRAQVPAGMRDFAVDIGGKPAQKAEASQPLPVYSIPIDVLAERGLAERGGKALSAAQQHGWRVLTSDSRGVQLVDVAKDSELAVSVRRGSSVAILAKAGAMAEERASADISYEPRILDFGRLGMSALWLHSDQGLDRFFTLELEPKERSEAQLLNEAGARARVRLGAIDHGGGVKDDVDGPPDLGG